MVIVIKPTLQVKNFSNLLSLISFLKRLATLRRIRGMGHEESKIAWHPAFVEALQLELEAYREALEFHPEYQLTSEPLKIDCVIIKKAKDVVIKKNIAAIFREWNLLEYKSPGDYVSVYDFYKVYGYCCLYASFQRVPISSLTVSFIESRYPEKLFKHFEEDRFFTVEETGSGIYIIRGDIIPIQVIDSRRLRMEENLWLKGLSKRLDGAELNHIGVEAYRRGKAARLGAYMDAIMRANPAAMKEIIAMGTTLTLEEVLEEAGLIAKWEARGIEKGMTLGQERLEAVARNALAEGLSIESVSRITGFDVESLREMRDK